MQAQLVATVGRGQLELVLVEEADVVEGLRGRDVAGFEDRAELAEVLEVPFAELAPILTKGRALLGLPA